MKKRRLTDLYLTGRPVVIDDGDGGVEVWLQKPGTIEHENCLRRANAARARGLMVRIDRTSEEWQSAYSEAEDAGDREFYIDYLIQEPEQQKREAIEAQVAAEEEWSKDNYLQGLFDSWKGEEGAPGLEETYAKDPEDPEASQVFNEMKRYLEQVQERMEPEIQELRREFQYEETDILLEKVTERFVEQKANGAWMRELTLSELFYAIREPEDHSKRYFDRREDLDVLAPEVINALSNAYRALTVDPVEGKGSEATDSSSQSSEQPATEAPASLSGPEAVAQ